MQKTMQISLAGGQWKKTQLVILSPWCGPGPPVTESPGELILVPCHLQTHRFHPLELQPRRLTCLRGFPGDYLLLNSCIKHVHSAL